MLYRGGIKMPKCKDCDVNMDVDEIKHLKEYCIECVCEFCSQPFSKVGYYQDGECKKCHDIGAEMVEKQERFQHENA